MDTKQEHIANILVSPTLLQSPRMDTHLDQVMNVDNVEEGRINGRVSEHENGHENLNVQINGNNGDLSLENSSRSSGSSPSNDEPLLKSQLRMDLTQMDSEVAKVIMKIENIIDNNRDKTTNNNSDNIQLMESIKNILLRLNLKNTLLKNEISSCKDEYQMERYMLLAQIEGLEKKLRIIQDENEQISSRNLKLIKYANTLKNEKLKVALTENHHLREHIAMLESSIRNNTTNNNNNNNNSGFSYLPSPLNTSSVRPISINNNNTTTNTNTISSTATPIQNAQILSPTNGGHMLDTLGRLASEYLNNEYPKE